MKMLLVGEIRELINGQLIRGFDDLPIHHAVYHSKLLTRQNTMIFVRSHPKQFNWEMVQRFMPCAVVTEQLEDKLMAIPGCTIIKVEDVEAAYWTFVDYYRGFFQIPVVAVTGTSGKSTTKDMIKHILQDTLNVQGTVASANGRPRRLNYLLGIDETTEAAVFETAVGSPGVLAESCKYFKPSIGIITNIGVYHLDGCKTLEAYIQAKAEMVTGVNKRGVLILNADDEHTAKLNLERFKGRIVYFGSANAANFQASKIQYGENGMDFILTFQNKEYPVFVPGFGEHQVYNALAALAAVYEIGIGIREAVKQLETFKNIRKHLEVVTGIAGATILDDTWNITPSSLQAGLAVLSNLATGRKKVALIGDINRLGELYREYYSQIGKMIADSGLDMLITVGTLAAEIATQASEKGFTGEVLTLQATDDLYHTIKKVLDKNTIILVKCSGRNKPIMELTSRLINSKTDKADKSRFKAR